MSSNNLDPIYLNTSFISLLLKRVENKTVQKENLFISPLFGSTKALFISQISKKINQVMVLLPDSKSVKELNVELNVLGVSKRIIIITEFT
ncbi:MAG TPA: hypothetical protein ENI57_03960, partial [Ignavibacteria bacterium]|nr:hypothetical protein [Ignavibacteria bacterium]